MKASLGARLTWGSDDFIVIAVDYRYARLRSLSEDYVREVVVEELVRLPDVVWHDCDGAPAPGAEARVLDELPVAQRRVIDAWVEQLTIASRALERGVQIRHLVYDVRKAMAAVGEDVSTETVRRRLRRFQDEGVLGLIDRRGQNRGQASIDPRIADALSIIGSRGAGKSSGTHGRSVAQLRWLLEEKAPDLDLPSERTLQRLLAGHPTASRLNKSARARRVADNKPQRAFGMHGALRPGEHVQIDSTVIDVPSRLVDGRLNRAELTIMHDVATRSILAAILRAVATNSADLAGLLARALVPYDLRPPGAREQRERMSATWAGQFLIDQARLDRHRLEQPYIFPETVTVDNGKIYRSESFRERVNG